MVTGVVLVLVAEVSVLGVIEVLVGVLEVGMGSVDVCVVLKVRKVLVVV